MRKLAGKHLLLLVCVYQHGLSFTYLGPCLEHRVGISAAQRAMGQGALAGANCTALEAVGTGCLCLCLFNIALTVAVFSPLALPGRCLGMSGQPDMSPVVHKQGRRQWSVEAEMPPRSPFLLCLYGMLEYFVSQSVYHCVRQIHLTFL